MVVSGIAVRAMDHVAQVSWFCLLVTALTQRAHFFPAVVILHLKRIHSQIGFSSNSIIFWQCFFLPTPSWLASPMALLGTAATITHLIDGLLGGSFCPVLPDTWIIGVSRRTLRIQICT